MKRTTRAKLTTDSRTYKIITTMDSDPYWDEGIVYYTSKGLRNRYKGIEKYEYRMYRSWKYNRKTQWKIK